tara:strand:+ start:114 stop:296 length:183 start_codon:yes stop_codon:yes gene_type:complete
MEKTKIMDIVKPLEEIADEVEQIKLDIIYIKHKLKILIKEKEDKEIREIQETQQSGWTFW